MKIISFEGIDACGKNTQSLLLAKYLQTKGYSVKHLSFPDYNSHFGECIKEILQKKPIEANQHIMLQTYNVLSMIDTMQRLRYFDFLVIDRYFTSTIVYGSATGVDESFLKNITHNLPLPTVNIMLDISVDESFNRRIDRRDSFEKNRDLLEKVRQCYKSFFIKTNGKIIDASCSVDVIHDQIVKIINV